MKKGDWIKCHDDEEIRQYLTELGKKWYGAVRSAGNYIIITSEPEQEDD